MKKRFVKIAGLDLTFQGTGTPLPAHRQRVRRRHALQKKDPASHRLPRWEVTRLFDGFHHVAAATSIGRKRLEAEIRTGDRAVMDADWNREQKRLVEA